MSLVMVVTGLVCAAFFAYCRLGQRFVKLGSRFRQRSFRFAAIMLLGVLALMTVTESVHARQPQVAAAWQSLPEPAPAKQPNYENAVAARSADPNLRSYALDLVNLERRQRGQGELAPDSLLDQVAQAHAQDMLQRNYFDHRSPEGNDPRDRFLQFGGQRGTGVGENIFYYRDFKTVSPTPEMARIYQEGWMNSPGHRDNLLFKRWKKFGYGVAVGSDSRQYAVQMFSF